VESWHLGEGWYTDGWQRNIDHYNAWVIHPFLWAWYDLVGAARDPAAAALWRGRLDNSLQGAPLLMLMAKSRHKRPENVRRYFKPSP
jgi:hypothetical protein